MANKPVFIRPKFPEVPEIQDRVLRDWLRNFKREADAAFLELERVAKDVALVAGASKQIVDSGFSIAPITHNIELRAAAPVTSAADVAIEAGEHGQTIILENTGEEAITIKDSANTKIGGDQTLAPGDTISVRYSINTQQWTRVSQAAN